MRILHVLDHSLPLHSGYAFRTAAILREQQRLGWVTAQVTGPKHTCAEAWEMSDGLRYVRTSHTLPSLGRMPVVNQLDVVAALRRQVARVAAEFKPHIIQAHSPCLNGLAAAGVARQSGVPLIYELRASWEDAAVSHGSTTEGSLRYRISKALETHVVRTADAVTTICQGLRQDLVSRGVPANAVDPEHFSGVATPDAALKARFCRPGGKLLGFLGSFYAYEGLDLLVRAMPGLLARNPAMHLLLVGGGPEEARLKDLVRELGLTAAVTFRGRVSQKEVPAFYGIMDLLVYPRRRNRLTDLVTPLKPLEAMAQFRLVAAADVGGHRELIVDGQTGFLFPPDDPAAIERVVTAALASPDPEGMRRRARRYVEETRTWARVVAGYAPLYARLLADAKRAGLQAGAHG